MIKNMVNNINSGFEEIFTKHNLSDEKILSILKFLTNSQLNIKKNQFEILQLLLFLIRKAISFFVIKFIKL